LLPGLTTRDALAARVRTEVNTSICVGIYDQLSEAHRERLLVLLSEKESPAVDELGETGCGWTASPRGEDHGFCRGFGTTTW
jgi:hypothetical protein